MNGYLIIGTEIDTKGLEKGIKEAQKQLEQYEKETEELERVRQENELKIQEEYNKKKKELKDEATKKIADRESERGEPLTDIELQGIENTYYAKLRQLDNEFKPIRQENEAINQQIKANTEEQTKLNEKIKEMNEELQKTKQADNIKNIIKETGKELEKNARSVKKWVLGVFGVYSAYGAIRNAMNVISSNDAQLKADIDYMKNVLAYTLEPVVRAIVNLAKQLLNYVAYIAKIFGVHIFENASNNLKKANKQAKALSKTLAGFDEMNILGGNTGSSSATPSFDLAMPTEPPEWITRLPGIIAGIATALGLLKLSELAEKLKIIKGHLTGIQALGIGIAITGIIWTIQDLIKFLNDPTFDNFIAILRSISVAILGIGIAAGSLPTIIAGIIGGIIYLFLKNYDTIMQKLKDFDKFMVWLWDRVNEFFGPIGQVIYAPFMAAVIIIRHTFEDLLTSLKRIVNGIVMIFKGDLKGGVKEAFGGLIDIVKKPLNRIIDYLNTVIRGLNRIQIDMPDWLGGGKFGFNISTIPKLAKGGIINMPGRGVPIAAGGERGAEGVIPLTDSQQMALLGEAIGKYITVNANIVNTMNGRVISRELQKVQNDSDFAYNR